MITIHVTYPLLGLKKSLHGARKGSPFSTLGPGTSWAVTFYNVIGNAGSHPGKEISQIATSCGRNAGRERDFVVHSLVWWEKSIATWHGAIIAEGGTILGGSASQTLRLVPMGWIQLLQTWSHERLALMFGFGHSEKFGNWNWPRRCADFSVGNILPAANFPSVNCRLSRREIVIAPHYHFLPSTFSSFPHLIVAFVLLI